MSTRVVSSGLKINEAVLLRIGLLCAGAWLILTALHINGSGLLPESRTLVYLMIAAGGAGLALILVAGLCSPLQELRWLILVALLAEILISTLLWVKSSPRPAYVRIDAALNLEMAADMVRHGKNPYDWDFSGVYEIYRTDQASLTPTIAGSNEGHYAYPALSFLLALPFRAVGLPGAFTLLIVSQIVVLMALFLGAPRSLQPLILFPLVVGTNFTTNGLLGGIDIVWALLLTLMILAWRKPYLRAVLYGMSAAYKQNVWMLAPFLLIRLWKENQSAENSIPWREIIRFVAVSAGTFLVINLPFAISNLVEWMKGIITPFQSNLVLLSQGSPSGLVQFGYLSLPRSYFSLVTLAVGGMLLLIYWRHFEQVRELWLLAPALMMWFSPRTLIAYWDYWFFPALASVYIYAYDRPPARAVSWKPTLQLTGLVSGILIILGAVMARTAPISVQVLPPYITVNGMVFRLTVQVENNSPDQLVPRFMVQHRDTAVNPLPWLIESGPASLAPGETALYQIASDGQPGFAAHDPAQIVVTDAGGNQNLRAVTTIGPDQTFLWPDAIPNPDFLYWDKNTSTPIFWDSYIAPSGVGSLSLDVQEGRTALAITLDSPYGPMSWAALNTAILWPREPISLWVYVEDETVSQRGIEIIDNERRLTFLFGTGDRAWQDGSQHYVIERRVPLGEWSRQTFDLQAAYDQAGWDPPAFEHVTYRNVTADFQIVTLTLFVSAPDASTGGHLWISAVEQGNYRIDPADLMADTLEDPAGYYVRLGKFYEAERLYDLALEAYQHALTYAPNDSTIRETVNQAEDRLEETHPDD